VKPATDPRPACCSTAKSNAWWKGYAAAIDDLERALRAGEPIDDWIGDVRAKFAIPTPDDPA